MDNRKLHKILCLPPVERNKRLREELLPEILDPERTRATEAKEGRALLERLAVLDECISLFWS